MTSGPGSAWGSITGALPRLPVITGAHRIDTNPVAPSIQRSFGSPRRARSQFPDDRCHTQRNERHVDEQRHDGPSVAHDLPDQAPRSIANNNVATARNNK
jgi:hypothetical protein